MPVLGIDGQTYHVNLRYGLFQQMIREAAFAHLLTADTTTGV